VHAGCASNQYECGEIADWALCDFNPGSQTQPLSTPLITVTTSLSIAITYDWSLVTDARNSGDLSFEYDTLDMIDSAGNQVRVGAINAI